MGVDVEMYVKTKTKLSDDKVLDLAFRLAAAFGPEYFWMEREGDRKHHCLSIIKRKKDLFYYIGDIEGYQILRVYLSGRYYGELYERGYFPLYRNVAEWLEYNIPGCEIWYGGDTGADLKHFNNEMRQELWKYYCKNANLPYVGFFDAALSDNDKRPICDLCQKPMIRNGFGPNYAKYYCAGCDYEVELKGEEKKA